MAEFLIKWLTEQGISEGPAVWLGWAGLALAVTILAFLSNFVAKHILLVAVRYVVRKSRTRWDDALLEHHVFTRLSHLAPVLVIYSAASLFPPAESLILRFSMVYMLLVGLLVFNAFLKTVLAIYRTFDVSRQRPIKGYVQIVQIVVFVFVGIIAVSQVMGQKPWLLLSGMGAMTAILLLVFKDSILGLVASIQLTSNDMVRIGDWIEMPKYGADGDVVDVTLHTVKVQNWDKTITTIPAYSLISDSFKNWRGMAESGGRRIKRAIHIDLASIKFCTSEMLGRFEKFQLITDYIRTRKAEISEYNREHQVDTSELINGRNLTNVGIFRAYLVAYLRHHPKIHQDLTFLIRHLPPGEQGLPIEIYVFSNDQEWVSYEAIQADIFDHIMAVVPMFDLRLFQNPTGADFREFAATGE
ncbi:MAG: mechanosensitive ion channel family protein [bacterium]